MTTNKELRELAEKAASGAWYEPGDLLCHDNRSGDTHGLHHDDDGYLAAASPATVLILLDEIERLQAECEGLRKDAERIEWLEAQTKKSYTGISFDYHRHVEDGYVVDHGYRFMRRHFASGFKDSLRKAIDAAMAGGDQ